MITVKMGRAHFRFQVCCSVMILTPFDIYEFFKMCLVQFANLQAFEI